MKRMEDLTYRYAYWDDPQAKDAFKEFLIAIHGLDLTLWDEKGFWDREHYIPFSLFDDRAVVASACLFSMEMTINGKPCLVGQFSGVGTHPDYRRRCLNHWLTGKAIEWASPAHDGFFLLSTDQALPFYAHCGFVPVTESISILKTAVPEPRPELRKLDIQSDNDLELIYRIAEKRLPVSVRLGVGNSKLLMFHCLYTLSDHIYYIPNLDLVVFIKSDNGHLILYDIVGREIPKFAEIYPYIAGQPHNDVRFHFVPDRMDIVPTGQMKPVGNNTHVLPPFELPGHDSVIPFTAHA